MVGTDPSGDHPFVGELRFRKEERLRLRREFLAAQKRGGRQVTANLVIYASPEARSWSRLGVTVSRKVGNSAVRSRVKRRLREIFRRNKSLLPVGFDLVWIARASAADAQWEDLQRQALEGSRKAVGRIRKPRNARKNGGTKDR